MAGIGEVEIELGGKKETLRCSLGAAKRVNSAGGFNFVLKRLAEFDLDYYVLVVSAGLNKKTNDMEDAVYEVGLPTLTEGLSAFVTYLANGGKPLKTTDTVPTGEA